MKNIGLIVLTVLIFVVLFGFMFLCWYLERDANYSWSYQAKTQEEIRRLVKPECLR